jgi:hypothetical protein
VVSESRVSDISDLRGLTYELRMLIASLDNILITKDGYDNLTDTPKEVEDILKLVNS